MTKKTAAKDRDLLPIDLEEVLPIEAMRRIGEVGLIGFLAEYVQERVASEPAMQWDPDFLAEYLPFLDYVLRYFDAEVEGFEHLPEHGPALLVGNHSGGTLVPCEAGYRAKSKRARGDDHAIQGIGLRYREQAAYPSGADAEPCSGREAYQRYGAGVAPMLAKAGARPVWMGAVASTVISPDGEDWDDAILVEYPSREAFIAMTSSPEYQSIAIHRTAALADSRLIASTTGLEQLGR